VVCQGWVSGCHMSVSGNTNCRFTQPTRGAARHHRTHPPPLANRLAHPPPPAPASAPQDSWLAGDGAGAREPPTLASGRKTMRQKGTIILCVSALMASSGCIGSAANPTIGPAETASSSQAIMGRISGTLRLVGGPAPGLRPIRHTKVNVMAGERVVATMTTDDRGRFDLPLPEGRYHFILPGGQELLPPTALVAASGTTHLSLRLDAR
jgi:hypothetical protein